jgi:ATP-dependent DNA helicase RecQ
VIKDIRKQLGDDLYISRGKLNRDSLHITAIDMSSSAERYAFILKTLKDIEGSGIIYCLTKRDCEYLAEFLTRNGVNAVSYYSGKDGETNIQAEKDFQDNKIKALVATVKLGMGYDKPDVAFVIHFQLPQNPVAYYQQIGRAGRNIDKAYAILLHGKEDEEIIDFFIEKAFPTRSETDGIIALLTEKGAMSIEDIKKFLNISHGRIEKTLYFLENDGAIMKTGSQYRLTANKYSYDEAKYQEITKVRQEEKAQLKELLRTKQCYSMFIRNCLDDVNDDICGKCGNCDSNFAFERPNIHEIDTANTYINGRTLIIEPRKKLMHTGKLIPAEMRNQEGLALAKYGDAGYGIMVKNDKYSGHDFCDALVDRAAEILKPVIKREGIKNLTYVPSLRSEKVKTFSKRLAAKCGIDCLELLKKSDAPQQKTMQNSQHQCRNAFGSFNSIGNVPEKLILIDDVVDSGCTLAACGYKLSENGCSYVFPFALADSKQGDDSNES